MHHPPAALQAPPLTPPHMLTPLPPLHLLVLQVCAALHAHEAAELLVLHALRCWCCCCCSKRVALPCTCVCVVATAAADLVPTKHAPPLVNLVLFIFPAQLYVLTGITISLAVSYHFSQFN